MKFQCVRVKESILQDSREKKRVSYKGIKMRVDLPTTMEVRRLQRRATTSNLEFFYSTKLSIKCEGRRKIFSVSKFCLPQAPPQEATVKRILHQKSGSRPRKKTWRPGKRGPCMREEGGPS